MSYEEIDERDFDEREFDCEYCVPNMKINCDLEVNVENKNKIIYVHPGKLQFFTAKAICCSGDGKVEIEYCGANKKCINGEIMICGHLGYYKIVSSGIIFMPKHKLSKVPEHFCITDILHFRAKSKCHECVEFVVVFTLSKNRECEKHRCRRNCEEQHCCRDFEEQHCCRECEERHCW